MPCVFFRLPSKDNSPINRVDCNNFVSLGLRNVIWPDAANTPMAMGKSNPELLFLTSAGPRLTTIRRIGKSNPLFLMAARTRSLDSFTA